MMKSLRVKTLLPVIGGILLIAIGGAILMSNLGLFTIDWELIIGPIFAAGGVIFLLVFLLDKQAWWALFPGFVLIGIGVIIFMAIYMDAGVMRWGGMVFLGMLSLAFLIIYVVHREHWWALIPGGVLLTLSVVTLFPGNVILSGGILFFGLALTFFMVYILPNPDGKMTWALYPAGILSLVGILAVLGATDLMNYLWPVVLLAAGGYVLFRAMRK